MSEQINHWRLQRNFEGATDSIRELRTTIEEYQRIEKNDEEYKIKLALEIYQFFVNRSNKTGEIFQALEKQGIAKEKLQELDCLIFSHQNSQFSSLRNIFFNQTILKQEASSIDIQKLDKVINAIRKIIDNV